MTERTVQRGLGARAALQNAVREQIHLQTPFTDLGIDASLSPSQRSMQLALSYLREWGSVFGLTSDHIGHLQATLGSRAASEAPGVQFRWGDPLPLRGEESTIWWLAQTQL